jgi:chromosomal replication initiation ATPase DnaA
MKKKIDSKAVQHIVHLIAEYYKVPEKQLLYGNRERRFCEPRHITAYCLYKYEDMGYRRIAGVFKKKSHATVWHSINLVSDWVNNSSLNKKAANCVQYVLDNTSD